MRPSDATAALDQAVNSAVDSGSYQSLNDPAAMSKIATALGSLTGMGGDAPTAPKIDPAKVTMSILRAAQTQPMKKFRHGGHVKGYASGGLATDAVQQALALIAAMGQGKPRANTGMYIGGASGDGVSDSVDIKVSPGEYVIPADVVSALGKGSSEAGAKWFDELVAAERARHIDHMKNMPPPR